MDQALIRLGLFVHIGSAILLFSGLAVELVAGHFLVRAEDTSQARVLARAAMLADRGFHLALVGLLLSGPDLASRTGFFEGDGVRGWIVVAIAVIVVLGAAGGMLHRRTFRSVVAAAGEGAQPIGSDLLGLLARPAPWVSLHAAVGAGLGTVWLMSNKPDGVLDAALVAVVGTALGALAGVGAARIAAGRLRA